MQLAWPWLFACPCCSVWSASVGSVRRCVWDPGLVRVLVHRARPARARGCHGTYVSTRAVSWEGGGRARHPKSLCVSLPYRADGDGQGAIGGRAPQTAMAETATGNGKAEQSRGSARVRVEKIDTSPSPRPRERKNIILPGARARYGCSRW